MLRKRVVRATLWNRKRTGEQPVHVLPERRDTTYLPTSGKRPSPHTMRSWGLTLRRERTDKYSGEVATLSRVTSSLNYVSPNDLSLVSSVRTVDRSTAASKDWPFTSGRSSDERTIRLTALSSPQRPTVLSFTLMMTRTSSRWSKPMRATSCRPHGFGDRTPTEWSNCCRKSRTPPTEN